MVQTFPITLVDFSEREQIWNRHKANSDSIAQFYASSEYSKYGSRIIACSASLEFELISGSLKLSDARFCRVRHCPVCQWRRSLKWKARAYSALPLVVQDFPKHRWIFLTLTIRNCPIEELRATLTEMHAAFKRLVKTEAWCAKGWIKSTEVTKGQDELAHPHFHILLMVPPSYFSGARYLSHKRWAHLWQQALRVDYVPIIDVRAIKPTEDPVVLIPEILKYQTKANDLITDQDWLLKLTEQLHQSRQVSIGGILRSYMRDTRKPSASSEDELADQENLTFKFAWNRRTHRYLLEVLRNFGNMR